MWITSRPIDPGELLDLPQPTQREQLRRTAEHQASLFVERLTRVDPLAAWLDVVAGLYSFAETRRELLLCHLKFRARLLHDKLRLLGFVEWID